MKIKKPSGLAAIVIAALLALVAGMAVHYNTGSPPVVSVDIDGADVAEAIAGALDAIESDDDSGDDDSAE
jgi:hypothetical protein